MARILLVEDDESLGDGLSSGLRLKGFAIDWVKDGDAAEAAAETAEYEAIILDLGLPRRDGMSVLARLRAKGSDVPVLIITARDALDARVEGLDAGADDYLVKPFAIDELAARLRALLRRRAGRPVSKIVHGRLEVDPASHTVRLAGSEVDVSPREFQLLQALLENRGRVLTKERLETALYPWGEEVESNAVEVHVHRLRKKLGSDLIRTIRGVGYTVAETAS